MPDLGIKGIVASPAMRTSQPKTYAIKGVIFPPHGLTNNQINAITGTPYARKGISTVYSALVPNPPGDAPADDDTDNPF